LLGYDGGWSLFIFLPHCAAVSFLFSLLPIFRMARLKTKEEWLSLIFHVAGKNHKKLRRVH
jgi:hypothetical protein